MVMILDEIGRRRKKKGEEGKENMMTDDDGDDLAFGSEPATFVGASPGFIDAGMSKPIYEDPKVRELRGGAVPSGRLGEADDIANAVLFLDSENASYVNGHNLVVDGGVISSVIAQLPRK